VGLKKVAQRDRWEKFLCHGACAPAALLSPLCAHAGDNGRALVAGEALPPAYVCACAAALYHEPPTARPSASKWLLRAAAYTFDKLPMHVVNVCGPAISNLDAFCVNSSFF